MQTTENVTIPEDHLFTGATSGRFEERYPVRIYDDGSGPLWIYNETFGVRGIVRADTWESAWEIVEDVILDDADPDAPETWARDYDDDAGEHDLAEGCYFRPNGVPTEHGLTSYIGCVDLNGHSLDVLTTERAEAQGIRVESELWE